MEGSGDEPEPLDWVEMQLLAYHSFRAGWTGFLSNIGAASRGMGRTGLDCSNRRRVSAEHASRMHLIRGNGSPSRLQIAVGNDSMNCRQTLAGEGLQSRWFMATIVLFSVGTYLCESASAFSHRVGNTKLVSVGYCWSDR